MQTKTMLSYCVYPSDWQKSKSLITYSVDKTIGKQAGLSIAGGSVLWHNLLEGNCVISIKVHMRNYFYSAIPFLRFYLILAKMQTDLKTRLFFAAYFSQQTVEYKHSVIIRALVRQAMAQPYSNILCSWGKNRKALSIPAWKYLLEVPPSDTREIRTSYTEHAPFAQKGRKCGIYIHICL